MSLRAGTRENSENREFADIMEFACEAEDEEHTSSKRSRSVDVGIKYVSSFQGSKRLQDEFHIGGTHKQGTCYQTFDVRLERVCVYNTAHYASSFFLSTLESKAEIPVTFEENLNEFFHKQYLNKLRTY
jgi:hypothetical protein